MLASAVLGLSPSVVPFLRAPTGQRASTVVLEGAKPDFVVEQHEWETQPNPQFDYKQDDGMEDAFAEIRASNHLLQPLLSELRAKDFFSYYAVDLLASCSYMPTTEAPCDLDACEIDPAEDVPARMIERDENEYEFELDSWARLDMPSDYTEYYSLRGTPSGYTEYNASRVL